MAKRYPFLIVLVLFTLLSGCSLLLVTPPPSRGDRENVPECTTSNLWPAVDSGLSIVPGTLLALVFMGGLMSGSLGSDDLTFLASATALTVIPPGASAFYGGYQVRRCRELQARAAQ